MITPQRARRALLAFVLVVPAYGIVAWQAYRLWQTGRSRIANAVPVVVAITESGIEERTGSFGRTFYAPRIRYGVRTREGVEFRRQVTPLDEASTKGCAQAIADRYAVGHVDTGWIDTTGDHATFLVREVGTFFYWILSAGLLVLGALAFLLRRAAAPSGQPAKQ
ncbi:MAG: hypothetical protein HY275_02625 [Gemmatimonadetes bacterium]|nr:hypothetical protein [Gemmatimonadota bacterium]